MDQAGAMNPKQMLGAYDTTDVIIDSPHVSSKSFLDLPKELRDIIYDLCLMHKSVQQDELAHCRRFSIDIPVRCDCFHHSLLRTCHLTRHEMLARFGTEHEFKLSAFRGGRKAKCARLSSATPELVANIRRLRITTDPDCPCHYHPRLCGTRWWVSTTLLLRDDHVDIHTDDHADSCELDLRGWSLDKVAVLSARLPTVNGRVYLTTPILSEIIEALRCPSVKEVKKTMYLVQGVPFLGRLWRRTRRMALVLLCDSLIYVFDRKWRKTPF
jgi:hypothetical protein